MAIRWGALIKSLELTKSIPTGITADAVEWAAPMYLELLDYKNKTDSLFEKANAAAPTGDKKALLDKAKQYITAGSTISTPIAPRRPRSPTNADAFRELRGLRIS